MTAPRLASSEYLERPHREPADVVATLRREADLCRRIAAQASAHCNSPALRFYEQWAAYFDNRADVLMAAFA